MAASASAPQLSPDQKQQQQKSADQQATQAIVSNAVMRKQNAGAGTVFPASNPQLIVQPINVGLVLRYILEINFTISNTGSVPINLTDTGVSNIFGPNGVQYTDLNNYPRINTSGLHLTLVANAKRRRPLGATFQTNTALGNNLSQALNVPPATWPVFTAPQTIAAGASGNCRVVLELPLAYSNKDLRGAIWANVLNAVQQLTLTWNATPVVAGTADTTYAIYSGAAGAAGNISSATYNITQDYYDQIPTAQGKNGPVTLLPRLSLSTVYELKQLRNLSIPANQEFYYPYSNQRSFLSTFAVFNDSGLAAGRVTGTDINYWALLAANSTYIWKLDALEVTRQSRDHLLEDLPSGIYYFPSRDHNIATLQYGNVQLTLNANVAGAGAFLDVMLEDFALLNTLQSGASLAQA
jgi:P3 major capsid protein